MKALGKQFKPSERKLQSEQRRSQLIAVIATEGTATAPNDKPSTERSDVIVLLKR
jgi:hypothetical protein